MCITPISQSYNHYFTANVQAREKRAEEGNRDGYREVTNFLVTYIICAIIIVAYA
jgi:hypothetical protein